MGRTLNGGIDYRFLHFWAFVGAEVFCEAIVTVTWWEYASECLTRGAPRVLDVG